jgi:hypothetical protein
VVAAVAVLVIAVVVAAVVAVVKVVVVVAGVVGVVVVAVVVVVVVVVSEAVIFYGKLYPLFYLFSDRFETRANENFPYPLTRALSKQFFCRWR